MDFTRLVLCYYPPEVSLFFYHEFKRIAMALERSDQANLADEARQTHDVKYCHRLRSYNSNEFGSCDINQVLHYKSANEDC